MVYLVIGKDHPDAAERRKQNREGHLASAKKLKEEGKLLYAVAMMEQGAMVGSVMVMEFASDAEFNEWKASEPYITGNVWGSVEISEGAVPPLFR